MEKDGEGQLDVSCDKWRSVTDSWPGEEYPTYSNRRKGNWIGHILRRNCLLKHITEGKIEGGIEVTGRRGRRRKQLLDDLHEKRRYWNLKEEAPDRFIWRTGFGRGYGAVVRRTTCWWMNEWMKDKVKRKESVSVSHTPSSKPYCVRHTRFYDTVCSVCYRPEELNP